MKGEGGSGTGEMAVENRGRGVCKQVRVLCYLNLSDWQLAPLLHAKTAPSQISGELKLTLINSKDTKLKLDDPWWPLHSLLHSLKVIWSQVRKGFTLEKKTTRKSSLNCSFHRIIDDNHSRLTIMTEHHHPCSRTFNRLQYWERRG